MGGSREGTLGEGADVPQDDDEGGEVGREQVVMVRKKGLTRLRRRSNVGRSRVESSSRALAGRADKPGRPLARQARALRVEASTGEASLDSRQQFKRERASRAETSSPVRLLKSRKRFPRARQAKPANFQAGALSSTASAPENSRGSSSSSMQHATPHASAEEGSSKTKTDGGAATLVPLCSSPGGVLV